MGRRKSIARRIGAAGMLMMIVGGALLVSAVSASAVSGTITLSPGPSTGYATGQAVTVSISGMSPSAQVHVYECSLAPDQPTVLVQGQSLPVSCTVPVAAGKTNGAGKLKQPLSTTVQSGVTGPPGPGVDTAGNQAAADAATYPCPQIVGQTGGCAFFAFDSLGGVATPLPPTTTTTAPCIPAPNTVSSGGLSVTVSPATCVKNGTPVTVTGSGFTPGATGSVSECSLAPGQPTISLAGNPLDVSCSNPIPYLATVSPTGTMSLASPVRKGHCWEPIIGGCAEVPVSFRCHHRSGLRYWIRRLSHPESQGAHHVRTQQREHIWLCRWVGDVDQRRRGNELKWKQQCLDQSKFEGDSDVVKGPCLHWRG